MKDRRNLRDGNFEKELKKLYPHYEVLGEYIDQNTEILIKCNLHNITFKTTARVILRTKLAGCPKCIKSWRSNEFINFLKSNHPNIDADMAYNDYINYTTPIRLICKLHPEEEIIMSPAKILKAGRSGKLKEFLCKSCKNEELLGRKFIDWIDKFNKKFPEHNFDFSNSSYKIYYSKNKKGVSRIDNVFCKDCGNYFSAKASILYNSGLCPNCRVKSQGEIFVEKWLNSNNLAFNSQVRISNKMIQGKFENSDVIIDFSLSHCNVNYWIEYNGEQHYTWCKHFQTLEKFEGQLRRDNNIREYCRLNNIVLIEIPYKYYTQDTIWELLDEIVLNKKSPEKLIKLPEINYNRGGNINGQ